eukprot:gene385-690_t
MMKIDEKVIVVGGGLSGLSAAHTAWESGCREVLLIDKASFCGGNSTKATSGINGAGTSSQHALHITDNKEIFTADIVRGGSKDVQLAQILARNSAPGIEWLKDKFSLDLSLVSRRGGHYEPRTHRGKAKFPGMTITYALLEAWEEICEKCPNAKQVVEAIKKVRTYGHIHGDIALRDLMLCPGQSNGDAAEIAKVGDQVFYMSIVSSDGKIETSQGYIDFLLEDVMVVERSAFMRNRDGQMVKPQKTRRSWWEFIIDLINHARGDKLITDAHGDVIGIEWLALKEKDKDGNPKRYRESGIVVLAPGGFGADFGPNSYIHKYRPDLMKLPTTNGAHCTGDGIRMAEEVGSKLVDREWIQVHPTGLVNPKEPDAKVKFLAAEALRGVGGVLLDKHGIRFSNELGRRDYVTGRMWKNDGPFRLCLNGKAGKEIEWHIKHYKGRGLMKHYKNCDELCADSGTMKIDNIKKTFDEHNEIDKKMSDKNSPPGPYDAYGGGKTYDKWGKKFFKNGPLSVDDEFHVGIVTPVIHYCMGGNQINAQGSICRIGNQPIRGLYGAGEVN